MVTNVRSVAKIKPVPNNCSWSDFSRLQVPTTLNVWSVWVFIVSEYEILSIVHSDINFYSSSSPFVTVLAWVSSLKVIKIGHGKMSRIFFSLIMVKTLLVFQTLNSDIQNWKKRKLRGFLLLLKYFRMFHIYFIACTKLFYSVKGVLMQ